MGLHENMQTEPVSCLSLRPSVNIEPTTKVRDAVLRMREARLGCAVVVNEQSEPLGIFTEAMLRNLMAEAPAVLDDVVDLHMAVAFPWVTLSDSIDTIVDAMEVKNARFVVVVDEQGKVAGLTGQKGLMEYVAEHFPGTVMVQRVGTQAYPAAREGA